MYYNNQLVQTGMESDIGEKLTTNVKKSYRLGIELTAGVNITKWLSLEGNAALSRNRILDFDEEASVDWEKSWRTIHYDNSTLAFSPSVLLNGFLNFNPIQAIKENSRFYKKAKSLLPIDYNGKAAIDSLMPTQPLVSASFRGQFGVYLLTPALEWKMDIRRGVNFSYKLYQQTGKVILGTRD